MTDGKSLSINDMNEKETTTDLNIRPIRAADNPLVADIIRQVMTEFGAVGEGYSIHDDEVDDMHAAYANDRAIFYVVTLNDVVLGCGGIGPLKGAVKDTCELKKMYFLPRLRGLGAGAKLLNKCLEAARRMGYRCCYLETTGTMKQAQHLYRKHGFRQLDAPMGNTGHCSCETWMATEL
jgi:putative acetyltransferase